MPKARPDQAAMRPPAIQQQGEDDAEDRPVPLVRHSGRGGGQVLYVHLQESKIGAVTRYGEAGPGPAGSVLTVSFELAGLQFTALNGGPQFKFTEAISFIVDCETQQEVDHYWDRLSEGGQVRAVRLAEGQVRPFVADRPLGTAPALERFRQREGKPGNAGDAQDDEDRDRQAGRGRCRLEYPCWSRNGLRPCSIVPEQSVREHDELSHDGRNGDL